jgi:predicted RND superfamily exporter protein
MITKYTQWIIRWRYFVVIATLAIIIISASGARFLTLNTNYRVFFSEENPQLLAFEKLQKTYTANDNVLFVLAPKSGHVFTQESLSAVEWLTKASWKIPYASRVDSISNYQHSYAQEDDLIVEDLVENAQQMDHNKLAKIKAIALTEPLLLNRLIDPKAHVTGINVVLQLNGVGSQAVQEIITYSRNLSAELEKQYPDIKVYLSGITALNNAFPEAIAIDFQFLVPLMYLLIIATVYFLLRTISGTFATIIIIGCSVAGAMGLAGWSGLELTSPMGSVPTIIMTLAVADCIHILTEILKQLAQGKDKNTAIIESLNKNFKAVFLTSITTAIGFLSLNFSDAPPFRDMGNVSAVGVMIAFFLAITFLPALMSILPIKNHHYHDGFNMAGLANFVIKQQKKILTIMIIFSLGLIAFIPKIEFNDEFVKYFSKEIQFRQHTDFISEHLTGIYLLEFSLNSGEPEGISKPEYLAYLEKFSTWIRQQDHVIHVSPISEIIKKLNKNLNEDKPEFYRLPQQRDMTAQYLLLYEMSLPFGLDLNDRIDIAKQETRLTITVENVDSQTLIAMANKMEQWLIDNTPEYMHTQAVSTGLMFSHIAKRNIISMLSGVFIALILISIILVAALKSWRIGLISLIPNLIPVLMAFGLWAILVGNIGLASSVVAAVTMGIVVDDTVHFLSKYLLAKKQLCKTTEESIQYAFTHVGTALTVTSIVLVIGFTTLSFSSFELNNSMGLLTAITLVFALITDFLLLPTLLLAFDKKANKKTN